MLQSELDAHIENEHPRKENRHSEKVLALLVELGELANETRCFKFWSIKPASPKEVILEEFVDGIHFILSLGIECGFSEADFSVPDTMEADLDATEQFLKVFQ